MKSEPPSSLLSVRTEPDQPSLLQCDCPVRELNDVKGNVVNPVSQDVICETCTEYSFKQAEQKGEVVIQ